MKKVNNGYTTLEEIKKEKLQVLTKISKQKESIANTWNNIFAPREANSKAEQVFNIVDNSMAIYDGAMLGYKLIRRLRGFSRHNKQ